MTPRTRPMQRMVALAAIGLLSLAAAACGSNDSPSDPAAQQPASDTKGTPDEQAIGSTVRQIQAAYYAARGEAVCARLTRAGQRELSDYTGSESRRTCPAGVQGLIERSQQAIPERRPRPEIVAIEVRGNTARAAIRLPGRRPAPVNLAKEDGTWKQTSFFLDYDIGR